MGESFHKLDSKKSMKIKEVLYVSRLKNNILYISALDNKGFRVAFVDGEVLMWPKGKTIDDVVVIGVGGVQYVINPNGTSPFECRHSLCWYTKGQLGLKFSKAL